MYLLVAIKSMVRNKKEERYPNTWYVMVFLFEADSLDSNASFVSLIFEWINIPKN